MFTELLYGEQENPCLCEACAEAQNMDMNMALPVTNSPRMGVCAYTGEYDKYQYTPKKFRKEAARWLPPTVKRLNNP